MWTCAPAYFCAILSDIGRVIALFRQKNKMTFVQIPITSLFHVMISFPDQQKVGASVSYGHMSSLPLKLLFIVKSMFVKCCSLWNQYLYLFCLLIICLLTYALNTVGLHNSSGYWTKEVFFSYTAFSVLVTEWHKKKCLQTSQKVIILVIWEKHLYI